LSLCARKREDMSGATAELVRLIDLSLGSQPSGAVNFNYLHALMHAIVGRLGSIEHAHLVGGAVGGLILPATGEVAGGGGAGTAGGGVDASAGGGRARERTTTAAGGGGAGTAGGGVDASAGGGRARERTTTAAGGGGAGTAGGGVDASAGGGVDASAGGGRARERTTTAAGGGGSEMKTGEPSGTEGKEGEVTSGTSQEPGKAEEAVDGTGEVTRKEPSLPPPGAGGDGLSESRISTSGRASRTGQHSSSDFYQRQKSTFVTAANDLGALERKLQELESRLNAMDTLPELLERKSSDMGATPIKDRWNFTNLSKRLSAAEDGLEQNSTVVDDLLGEVQNIKSAVTGCENSLSQLGDKLSGEIAGIMEQLKALDDLKMAAAKDSMGEAAAAILSELQSKIDSLQSELNNVKGAVESLDLSPFATRAEVEEQSQLAALAELGGRMESVEGHIEELKTTKLSIADMASLMPKGDSEETAAFLPRLMELQSRLDHVEGELGKATTLPPDVMDQISAMQKAIDKLTADLASLSSQIGGSSEERARLEELGSEVAQLRERMAEVDRSVGALTDAVSTLRDSAAPAEEEPDVKYADLDSLTTLQEMVARQQQEQERLIGTVAHVSNEMEINKEHVKALYSSVDELRATKADREQLEVEVREKADRAALEGKASREWVDSTFEKLDQKIREARDQLMGQEEALRSAVHRLDEDVETKLDKGELEPLKDYFDKKLARVKTTPAEREEALVEDAAGFRKPLRFRCISCDRPLGLKQTEAIPALPLVGTMPGTRSFRPYTTYELELIRRHQRMGLPVFGPVMQFSRGPRSAGGAHTLTRSRRRVRVAPLSSAYSPEPYSNPPSQVSVHHELDVMGQDGHVYKGRMSSRNKLPRLKNRTSNYQ
jgi:uncharacterized coiled-coil DUF342 family protein